MELNLENLYDDAFYVEQSNWKTWKSYDKEGNALVTSLSEEQCISATRFYLKGRQEGFTESATYEGQVGGKL
jgi:uncharacterized lipoprotein NlpE involved in copper resistance